MSEVTVYVKDGCPYCAKLVGELNDKGVTYSEKNVSRDKEALREAKEKYKADKVPVMVNGDKVTVGFRGNG